MPWSTGVLSRASCPYTTLVYPVFPRLPYMHILLHSWRSKQVRYWRDGSTYLQINWDSSLKKTIFHSYMFVFNISGPFGAVAKMWTRNGSWEAHKRFSMRRLWFNCTTACNTLKQRERARGHGSRYHQQRLLTRSQQSEWAPGPSPRTAVLSSQQTTLGPLQLLVTIMSWDFASCKN